MPWRGRESEVVWLVDGLTVSVAIRSGFKGCSSICEVVTLHENVFRLEFSPSSPLQRVVPRVGVSRCGETRIR